MIVRHLESFFLPRGTVHSFSNEFDFFDRMDLVANPLPIFVKFYVDSCTHCKSFKAPFQRFASFFSGKVDFFEVNCDEQKEFCAKSNAHSYPTLVLFTGEKRILFEENDRSLITIETFFEKHDVLSLRTISEEPPKFSATRAMEQPVASLQRSSATEQTKMNLVSENESLQQKVRELEEQIKLLQTNTGKRDEL